MTDFTPFSGRNLILTGYVGPDQPQLGRRIAAELSMPFVNTESQIAERVGLPVNEIRIYYGETRLKSIENEIIQEAALHRSTVLRASGRTLLNSDHLERLQQTGPVICLYTQLDAMLSRMHINMGARYHDPRERALALADLKREWAIRGQPGIHELDTTLLSNDEVVAQVIAMWQELAIVRG